MLCVCAEFAAWWKECCDAAAAERGNQDAAVEVAELESLADAKLRDSLAQKCAAPRRIVARAAADASPCPACVCAGATRSQPFRTTRTCSDPAAPRQRSTITSCRSILSALTRFAQTGMCPSAAAAAAAAAAAVPADCFVYVDAGECFTLA